MRRAADLAVVTASGPIEQERGGLVGKVQAIVLEHPGMTTKEIKALLARAADGWQVSSALNKLKNEGVIAQDWSQRRVRWVRSGVAPERSGRGDEVFCRCGTSILFGSLATAEERARPTCSVFPFALQGAA